MPEITQTIILSDGRTLGYTQTGSPSSSPPIFYLHGWPSSHTETLLWASAIQNASAYIITPDRPGMGHSTYLPRRKILDWPQDILELANQLKIPQFKILAASAGCPYALACVARIPEEMLVAVDIVSGFYPLDIEGGSMLLSTRIQFFVLRWFPWLVEKVLAFWFAGPAKGGSEKGDLFRERTLRAMAVTSEEDKRCLADERISEVMVETFRESLRKGSKGMTLEGKLLGGSWGFELGWIDGKNVCLWQGELDKNCPVGTTEEVVRMIPAAELKIVSGEGHLSLMVNRGEEILRHLMSSGS